METRVAVMGIILEDTSSAHALNALLHDYNRQNGSTLSGKKHQHSIHCH